MAVNVEEILLSRCANGTATPRDDKDDMLADWEGYNPHAVGSVMMAILSGPYPVSGDKRLLSTWKA